MPPELDEAPLDEAPFDDVPAVVSGDGEEQPARSMNGKSKRAIRMPQGVGACLVTQAPR
jgi:hypothetical protein